MMWWWDGGHWAGWGWIGIDSDGPLLGRGDSRHRVPGARPGPAVRQRARDSRGRVAQPELKHRARRAKRAQAGQASQAKSEPLRILEERYARGEIDREEFLQRKADLTP